MGIRREPYWRVMTREANRVYRAAEKNFLGLIGSKWSFRDRYRLAGYGSACMLYTLVISELERGALCRRDEKVKIYKRAALAFSCNFQRDMAWHCLDRLLALRTQKNDEYYFLEGFLHLQAEEPEKALICYEESLRLFDASNITTAYTLIQKAQALDALGRQVEAFHCAQEAVRIAPKKAVLWEVTMQLAEQTQQHQWAARARERMNALSG